jgi:hypothetical protein
MVEKPAKKLGKEDAQLDTAFVTDWWSRSVVQPALISLSVASLFTGIVAVSRSLGGSQLWMRFVWLFLLVGLEAIITTMWLNRPEHRNVDSLAYRFAELLVIILLVRLFTWTISGTWPHLRWLQNYLLTPAILIGDPLFVIGAILAILAWLRAISLSILFAKLAIDRAEANYYATPVANRESGNRPTPTDRGQLVESFFGQWITGAFVLIICTAITTFDLADLAVNDFQSVKDRLALQPEVLTALMVYFLSGFFLLGHARLAAMNARWLIGGTIKDDRVERSWRRNNLWLITIVAFVAAFLPLGSTLGASRILEAIIGFVFILFNTVLGLLLSLLSLLLPRTRSMSTGDSVNPVPPARPPGLPPAEPNQLLAMILSSLFWAVIIFVTVVAVGFFLRDRGVRVNWQMVQRAWHSFLAWVRTLWQDFSIQVDSIRQTVRQSRQKREKPETKPAPVRQSLVRINALSPRGQLRYFYLATVRRAGEQGVERQGNETPLEYARDLKDSWPQTETEVDTLTDAFVRARYSARNIEEAEASAVRRTWKQIRSHLRKRSRSQDPATNQDGGDSSP